MSVDAQPGTQATAANTPQIVVNGARRPIGAIEPYVTALEWLRNQGLTGAKEGCAEGECGACAVLLARPDGAGTRWTALDSCLVPAAALDGQELLTVEGLGTAADLHPVQRELAERGGSQCGYCTPGFVTAAKALLDRNPNPTEAEVRAALDGNICRCGTYVGVVAAALDAAKALKA